MEIAECNNPALPGNDTIGFLFLQFQELVLPLDFLGLDAYKPRSREYSFLKAVVSCDQVNKSVSLLRDARDPAKWRIEPRLLKFELFRRIDQIYLYVGLGESSPEMPFLGTIEIQLPTKGVHLAAEHDIPFDTQEIEFECGKIKAKVGSAYGETATVEPKLEYKYHDDDSDDYSFQPFEMVSRYTAQPYRCLDISAASTPTRHTHPVFFTDPQETPCVAAFLRTVKQRECEYVILLSPEGGDLFYKLQRQRCFSLKNTKAYIAELTRALDAVHSQGYKSYSLRPHDIKLDVFGHVIIYDVGFARHVDNPTMILSDDWHETSYPDPDTFEGSEPSIATAAWSLGATMFEMLYGIAPFYDEDLDVFEANIRFTERVVLPEEPRLPPRASDILQALLHKDCNARLGAAGFKEIRSHPFFDDIDWSRFAFREHAIAYYTPVGEPPVRPPSVPLEVRPAPRPRDWWTSIWDRIADNAQKSFNEESHVPREHSYIPGHLKERGFSAQESDRVLKTIELGYAVKEGDLSTVRQLLESGTKCDFGPHDQRRRSLYNDWAQILHDESFPEAFLSPLCRAVFDNKVEMIKLLLAHGASANATFHELSCGSRSSDKPHPLTCGTALRLAVSLEHNEIADLLVAAGAEIQAVQPDWPDHRCPGVDRVMWHKIKSRLAALRKRTLRK